MCVRLSVPSTGIGSAKVEATIAVSITGVASVVGGEPVDEEAELLSESESEQEATARAATHAIPMSLTDGLIG